MNQKYQKCLPTLEISEKSEKHQKFIRNTSRCLFQDNMSRNISNHCILLRQLVPRHIHISSYITYSGGSRIFPRGGHEPSRGGVNTPNFPENCMKSKEFGRPGGACIPHTPPRSANDLYLSQIYPKFNLLSLYLTYSNTVKLPNVSGEG